MCIFINLEQHSLVSGVETINMELEDSLVEPPSFPPYVEVDLGARSLVSGVGCNGPEKSPLLVLPVILIFASS